MTPFSFTLIVLRAYSGCHCHYLESLRTSESEHGAGRTTPGGSILSHRDLLCLTGRHSILHLGGEHPQVVCKTVQQVEGKYVRIFIPFDLSHTFIFLSFACTICVSPLYNL